MQLINLLALIPFAAMLVSGAAIADTSASNVLRRETQECIHRDCMFASEA
jgi:hypothetical protein